MSNPDDYRSNYNLSNMWTVNPGVGSTYGSPNFGYDVVAPGEVIMTTDLVGDNGYGPGNYIIPLAATSFSTPIVSGIAGILLEKNPNLSYLEVRDLIRNGAEKVRPTTYNYNMYPSTPGYNNEMFYGRVNCFKSLNQIVGVEETVLQKLTVQQTSVDNYLLILPSAQGEQVLTIVNALGQTVWEKHLNANDYQVPFSLESFPSGVFFLNLYESDVLIGNSKLVK